MANEWTDEELQASVAAYIAMLIKHRDGKPFVKKDIYRELAARYGRTEKAYEYRMQNVSYVLSMMGRDWLPGLVPAKNVGAVVAEKIEKFIGEAEGKSLVPTVGEKVATRAIQARKPSSPPIGVKKPTATSSSVTTYARDPAVRAWVLDRAGGKCESCGEDAPFVDQDDQPFLEVHHVRQLAESGSDTVSNAVALCPNCHRHLHYGKDKTKVREGLYTAVAALMRE